MPSSDHPYARAAEQVRLVVGASFDDADKAMAIIGTDIVNVTRRMVTNPSPSQPGQPPGLITGGLRLSYKWAYLSKRGRYRSIEAGSDSTTRQPITGRIVDYAAWLEGGTSRMEPRPHFRPAIMLVRQAMPEHFARAIVNAQRRQARNLRAMP